MSSLSSALACRKTFGRCQYMVLSFCLNVSSYNLHHLRMHLIQDLYRQTWHPPLTVRMHKESTPINSYMNCDVIELAVWHHGRQPCRFLKKCTGSLSRLSDGHRLFRPAVGVQIGQGYREIDPGQKRKMFGRIALLPAQPNNFHVLNPDGRGDKNIVKSEPEKKSVEPVEGHRVSMVGIF